MTLHEIELTNKGRAYAARHAILRDDLGRRIEAHLAAAEALIAALDEAEGDADVEDDGTGEPGLGWPAGRHAMGAQEGDPGDDREGDDADDEPSLGSPCETLEPAGWGMQWRRIGSNDQTRWAAGGRDDLEAEHDGAEPDVDEEYSLGWGACPTTQNCLGLPSEEDEENGDEEPFMGWSERDSLGSDARPDSYAADCEEGASEPRPDSEARGRDLAAAQLGRVKRRAGRPVNPFAPSMVWLEGENQRVRFDVR